MAQDVVLQAVLELSDQMKGMEERLASRLDRLEDRMDNLETRMDKLDTKLAILGDELLSTKADVKLLQQSKNSH